MLVRRGRTARKPRERSRQIRTQGRRAAAGSCGEGSTGGGRSPSDDPGPAAHLIRTPGPRASSRGARPAAGDA